MDPNEEPENLMSKDGRLYNLKINKSGHKYILAHDDSHTTRLVLIMNRTFKNTSLQKRNVDVDTFNLLKLACELDYEIMGPYKNPNDKFNTQLSDQEIRNILYLTTEMYNTYGIGYKSISEHMRCLEDNVYTISILEFNVLLKELKRKTENIIFSISNKETVDRIKLINELILEYSTLSMYKETNKIDIYNFLKRMTNILRIDSQYDKKETKQLLNKANECKDCHIIVYMSSYGENGKFYSSDASFKINPFVIDCLIVFACFISLFAYLGYLLVFLLIIMFWWITKRTYIFDREMFEGLKTKNRTIILDHQTYNESQNKSFLIKKTNNGINVSLYLSEGDKHLGSDFVNKLIFEISRSESKDINKCILKIDELN
uniref:Uncharacterized protein n=1 Tax=viral metagenome TaxID=1070528 RepID=A0A6C0JS64_9ZZZZ